MSAPFSMKSPKMEVTSHLLQDEVALVRGCKRGEPKALEQLVTGYKAKVSRIAYLFLRDRSELDDLTQDIFLAIFKAIPNFREDCSLSTWIYRITINHCLNWRNRLRIRFRKKMIPFDQPRYDDQSLTPAEMIANSDPNPERALQKQEEITLIQNALAKLPTRYRISVVLRDIEGLSYEEIALIVKQPLGTVKSRINRGRNRLREIVEEVTRL